MNINRETYEEYFLMYVDNELTSEERLAVEEFLQANPDLQPELESLQEVLLQPDISHSFGDKKSLFRTANPVNEENVEEYFVQYTDDELSLEEKEYTEQFVYHNPQYQTLFETFLATRQSPDRSVTFQGKEKLYRYERKQSPVIFIGFRKILAAASVILLLSAGVWYLLDTNSQNGPALADSQPASPKQNTQAATDSPKVTAKTKSGASVEEESPLPDNQENAPDNRFDAPANVMERKTSVENNFASNSNKTNPQNVKQESLLKEEIKNANLPDPIEVDVALHQPKKEIFVIDEAIGEEGISNNQSQPITALSGFSEDNGSDIVLVGTTSITRKNPLRGLLRKASRFVDKAANLDPVNEEKGIRIANLEFALR